MTISTNPTQPVSGVPPTAEGRLPLIVGLSAVAALGGFLFGFDSGVINGTVDALGAAFHTAGLGEGISVASLLLGCAAGALLAGPLADHYGRRLMMIFTSLLFVLSAIGTGAAPSMALFLVFRILGGLAIGAASVLAPAYIAEIAPAKYRGRLGSLQQLAIVFGLFSAFLSNYLLAHTAGTASAPLWFGAQAWRWMFWMEFFPSLAFFLGALWIPESPRWLISHNHKDGEKIFSRLYIGDAKAMVRQVKESLIGDHAPRLSDLFTPGTRALRPVIWIGIGLSVFQQAVGINVVFYYGSVLWQSVGMSESSALWINVLSGVTNIASTIAAILLIDRIGRKPLLWAGSLGMFVSLLVETIALGSSHAGAGQHVSLSPMAGHAALIAANVYIVAFGISWGPVVWVMLGEIFGNQYRGAALALAASIQWLANFLITVSFPVLLEHVHASGAYLLYTVAALLSFGFVLIWVPETRGATLESMK